MPEVRESKTGSEKVPDKFKIGECVLLTIARIMFSCSFLIAAIVIIGYASGITVLHTWEPSVGMAIPTAICIILNSVAGFALTTLIRYATNKPKPLE